MLRRQFCKLFYLVVLLASTSLVATGWADEPVLASFTDSPTIRREVSEELAGELRSVRRASRPAQKHFFRTPAMIGDFYAGNPISFGANATLDRLFVLANDLDVPLVLPGGGSTLTISEPGPVGIYASTLTSVQDIQTLLLAAQPLPAATLVGTVTDNATLTTSQTITQIQNSLAATGAAFDIVLLASPPGSYNAAVHAAFLTRNGIQGVTTLNNSNSGAILQGGVDTLNGGEDFDAFYFYDYVIRFNTVLADATSGGVGRMKVAEGGSVLPQNRVFFRYNHLSGVGYSDSRAGLNRFVPGFERAFLNGLFSFELRAPFATDARTNSTLEGNSITNGKHTRFGNLAIYLKALLIERQNFALSGGLGLALPTASDINVNYADGTPLLKVDNQSVRLQPFLGAIYAPNRDWFVQSFLQVDTGTGGNSVSINSTGTGLTHVGSLTDSSNLFLDMGIGHWLYRTNATRGLTGVVPMLEIHHNVALQDQDLVTSGPFQVTNSLGSTGLTNFVVGNTFEFGQKTRLTGAYTGPIGGGRDRQYYGALQLFLSHGF